MPYEQIDPMKIKVRPLAERRSFIEIEDRKLLPGAPAADPGALRGRIDLLADRIRKARRAGAAVMLTYGAHLIKNGAGPLVNALIEDGFVTHVATHGAGVIHDWEFAFEGRSSESVRDNAAVGQFGAWEETGRCINLAALAAAAEGIGLGEGIGRFISKDGVTLPEPEALAERIRKSPADPLTAARADLLSAMATFKLPAGRIEVRHPFKEYSVSRCAFERRVPFTVHPGIGYDIITNHPMFHGGAIGRSSATDARIFAGSALRLSGGVYLSVGSAVMSPQVFEKAFSLANNLLLQSGRPAIHDHFIAVVDIQEDSGWDWQAAEPPADHPAYYLRFCKSFYRMGGQTQYLCGDNRLVLGNLVKSLRG